MRWGGNALVIANAQFCRRKAEACWRAARHANDPQRKREFEELAQAWLRLADRAQCEPQWRLQFITDKKPDPD